MECSGRGCRTAVGGRGGCLCPCGGVNHGIGRIDWASNPTSNDYLSAKSKAISHVNRLEILSKPKVLPSQGSVRILQEHIRTVEIVTWLINNPSELQQIEKLYDAFQNAMTNVIKGLTKKQLKRLSDHFWCDFFASLVYLIDQGQITVSRIQKYIAGQISSTLINTVFNCIKNSRGNSYGNPLATRPGNRIQDTRKKRDSLEGLANALLKPIITDALVASFKSYSSPLNIPINSIKVHFQILALLLCPDPESHKLVWDQCLAPLLAAQCAQSLKNILTNKNILIPISDSWDSPQAITPKTPVPYIN